MVNRLLVAVALLTVFTGAVAEKQQKVQQLVSSVPTPAQSAESAQSGCLKRVSVLISDACDKAAAKIPGVQRKNPWRTGETAKIYCGQIDKGVAQNLVHSVSKKYRACPGAGAEPKEAMHVCDFTINGNYIVKVQDIYNATCSP